MGGSEPLYFVLGMDALLTLPTWHEWQAIGDLAHLVVMSRPGYEFRPSADLAAWLEGREVASPQDLVGAHGLVCRVALTQWPVAATDIRAALQRGEAVGNWLPAGVADYISRHHLYQ